MYNGKFTGLIVKPKKTILSYTSSSDANIEEEFVNETFVKTVDCGISETFNNTLRMLIGHGLTRIGLNCSNLTAKEMKNRKCVDMPEFKNFTVQSFSLTGDGNNEAIQIGLIWNTDKGEKIALNIPKIAYRNGSYEFQDLLADDIASIINECNSFLKGENYYGQLSLEFEDKNSEEDPF